LSRTSRARWLMPTSRGFVASVWVIAVMRVTPGGRCGPHALYMLMRVHVFGGTRIAFAGIKGRRVLGGGDYSPRRAVMDMITKLPEMSDDALVNLRTNAKRLQQSGNPSQRSNAATLLPAVEAEIGARRLAKVNATRSALPNERTGATRPAKRAQREAPSESV